MRIRYKPWARPELAACPFCVQAPAENRGKWNTVFPKSQPIHMELGCGKGGFISQLAPMHPEINYIAVDIKPEMLGLAKRKLEAAYAEKGIPTDNIRILIQNIESIDLPFGDGDSVERIYINFCNPWPRKKHNKRRLTHPRQLMKYRTFLSENGEIHFKTDDDELFEDSIAYFEECGFEITYLTRDLHAENRPDNILTEHENMFTEEGKKIKMLIAKKA